MSEVPSKLVSKNHLPAQAKLVGGKVISFTTRYASIQSNQEALANERQAREAAEARAIKAEKEAEKQAKLANRDVLTGLYNRRALAGTYEGLLASANAEHHRAGDIEVNPKQNKTSLLLLDLDHFKSLNDKYGHGYGDEVLEETADILRENSRERDLAFRYGGEELGILLPRTDAEGALIVAEKVRSTIQATGKVTASIGITSFDPLEHQSLEQVIEQADVALYAAKNGQLGEDNPGRNQVVAFAAELVANHS